MNIDELCKKYNIKNYHINSDGSVDVYGDVDLSSKHLNKIPLKFRNVYGDFHCSYNIHLSNLKGSPIYVEGNFSCMDCGIINLIGSPKEVGGDFKCGYNKLISLENAPLNVGGGFYCQYNKLKTLKYIPEYIGGNIFCHNNKLSSFEYIPEIIYGNLYCYNNNINSFLYAPKEILGDFYCDNNCLKSFKNSPRYIKGVFSCCDNFISNFENFPLYVEFFECDNNPIHEIWCLFEDPSKISLFNDIDIIRTKDDENVVILKRLNFFLESLNKNPIEELKNYTVI